MSNRVGRPQRARPSNFHTYYYLLTNNLITKQEASAELKCSYNQLNIWCLEQYVEFVEKQIIQLRKENRRLLREIKELKGED